MGHLRARVHRTAHAGKLKSKAVRRARPRSSQAASPTLPPGSPVHTPPHRPPPRVWPAPSQAPPLTWPHPHALARGLRYVDPQSSPGRPFGMSSRQRSCGALPSSAGPGASRLRLPVHWVPPPEAAARPVIQVQALRLLPKGSAFQHWAAQSCPTELPRAPDRSSIHTSSSCTAGTTGDTPRCEGPTATHK